MMSDHGGERFALVVLALEPWASRTERRELRRLRVGRYLLVMLAVVLALAVALCVWWVGATVPPPRAR
jgi:hypothetical protein